jgi:glycine betaine catabolism B
MLSMSRWLRDQDSDSNVVYFHCARTEADLMFAGEVAEMAQSNSRFVQHISLTRSAKPANGRRKGSKASTTAQWAGLTGYLDAAMLRTVASDYQEREIYVCGPTGFMEGTKALVEAAGFDMRHYHEESFGTSNKVTASGGVLWLSKSGIKVACSGEQSILDLAQQAGVTISSACRTGDCGECKVRLISGEAPMANTDGLDAHELEAGAVLSCVAFVNGEVAIDA